MISLQIQIILLFVSLLSLLVAVVVVCVLCYQHIIIITMFIYYYIISLVARPMPTTCPWATRGARWNIWNMTLETWTPRSEVYRDRLDYHILYYPMLTMLTWMRPAYVCIILMFYKTVIPDNEVLVRPNGAHMHTVSVRACMTQNMR